MTVISRRRFLSASTGLAAGLLAAPSLLRAASPVQLRLAVAEVGVANRPYAGSAILSVAHAKGFVDAEFKDDPAVDVVWTFHKGGGPSVNEAFANNQTDIGFPGDLPALIGRSNGLDHKVLSVTEPRANIYVAAHKDSGIKTIADLKGRSVGIFRGSNLHLAAVSLLAAHDLSERDLKVVNLDNIAIIGALANGDIDAAIGQADLYDLQEKGLATVIESSKEDARFARSALVVGRSQFINEQPEVTQRLINAFVKAAHWGSDEANREAVLDLLALTGRDRKGFVNDYAEQTTKYRLAPLLDDYITKGLAVKEANARALKLIRRDVPVEGWFEPSFLNKALEDQGLKDFWPAYGADGKPVTA